MRPDALLLMVTARLEVLGLSYCVGGSFASGAYGRARTTYDLDILLALRATHITEFIGAFQEDFDLNPAEVSEAVQLAPQYATTPEHRALIKIYHRRSHFRIDFFVSSGRAFEREQFQRCVRQIIATNPEIDAAFSSPEDTILAKLEWFRLGNYASTHQWPDVQAMILIQHEVLAWDYLRQWADTLGVRDLLERAARGESAPASTDTPGAHQQRLFE